MVRERTIAIAREDPGLEMLTAVESKILGGKVAEGMQELLSSLQVRRLRSSESAWSEFVAKCLAHPLCALVHQDPFTYRTFSKPRGYAGDAVMLDYVYGREEGWPVPPGTTPLGAEIFHFTTGSAACEAVRARRGHIADLVDRLADETPNPDILAVASGHLREAMLCSTIRRRRFNRYIALDSDPVSLEEVKRCYGRFGVQTCNASVRQLLTRRLDIGLFDLIYSTGLFDYMQLPTARRLTASFFEFLRPRGRLLVANFLPGILGVGYMESYMDWKLTYRNQMDMLAMADEIALQSIQDIRIFAEENHNIIFLQITKR
jgi:extracellular factor (EF) 3-hydroxypalmitic acid methyl ester biosynthesis protein